VNRTMQSHRTHNGWHFYAGEKLERHAWAKTFCQAFKTVAGQVKVRLVPVNWFAPFKDEAARLKHAKAAGRKP